MTEEIAIGGEVGILTAYCEEAAGSDSNRMLLIFESSPDKKPRAPEACVFRRHETF